MKLNIIFINFVKYFLTNCLILLIFYFNYMSVNAFTMNKYQDQSVVEELRLSVPFEYKETWLKAEKEIWEPWLAGQEGFLRRDIFYNKEKGEALILLNWENKRLWKNISIEEVNEIQFIFEENVKESLKVSKNPFKLIYEGELYKEG